MDETDLPYYPQLFHRLLKHALAHAQQNDFRFIVPPLKGVELGHGNENEQTRSLTLPSAAPLFATQPFEVSV